LGAQLKSFITYDQKRLNSRLEIIHKGLCEMQKTIVILANSIKNHGHCVAGKCVVTKEWMRPVGDSNGKELTNTQAKAKNPYGVFGIKVLQKIIVEYEKHSPLVNQPENYVINATPWVQNFSVTQGELVNYLDAPVDLWGLQDRVTYQSIVSGNYKISQSLYLIQVTGLTLLLNRFGKRRAQFSYGDHQYDLSSTDPKFDNIIATQAFPMNVATLCVSLGEPYTDGSCYKIVAAIFI
jgi:hypothetical protein